MARPRRSAKAPPNGDDQPPAKRGRGRPPKVKVEVPEAYTKEQYEAFLRAVDRNSSDFAEVQADRREIFKAESTRGLNPIADKLVRSLRAKVANDRMTLRDAQEVIDDIGTLWDWTGLPLALASDQARRDAEDATEPMI